MVRVLFSILLPTSNSGSAFLATVGSEACHGHDQHRLAPKSTTVHTPAGGQRWAWNLAPCSGPRRSHQATRCQLSAFVLLRISLASQLERVYLLSLLAQGLIHAAQVVAHHAQLVLVASLGRRQLIL